MKMNFLSLIIGLLLLVCCNQLNNRFVRKRVEDGHISICWYYYSYISNVSPDFVEVQKGNEVKRIYEAVDVVTDVILKNDTILIKLFEPERGIVYTDSVLTKVFDYHIVFDDNSTYLEYRETPDGVKE